MTTTALTRVDPRPGTGEMFDGIARRYDLLNLLASFGLDRRWRRALVRALAPRDPGGVLVDVATGTADVALALGRAYPQARLVGVDPSGNMLRHGAVKLARGGVGGRSLLLRGDGQALPLPDGVAEGVGIAFGIRNVPDRAAAAREMARVARPGAPLAVLELGEPRAGPLRALARLHVHAIVPRLGAWLSGAREYRYLASSIAAFPPPQEFAAVLAEQGGWREVRVQRMAFDAAHLYVGRAP